MEDSKREISVAERHTGPPRVYLGRKLFAEFVVDAESQTCKVVLLTDGVDGLHPVVDLHEDELQALLTFWSDCERQEQS